MTFESNTRPDLDPSLLLEALDALQEGIQILSYDWRYLYVNDAVARQGRRSRHELLGKRMVDCYPGIEKTPMFSVLQRCMTTRAAETIENEFAYPDGSRAWFELRVRPCPPGLVVASLEVTERKLVELRIHEAHAQALRALITPVIRVHRGVLLVPLIGALDSERSAQLADRVLLRVEEESAEVVIFDVAGVPELDTAVANHLLETTAMLKLLGATSLLTGLAPAAARAMVQLGVDLSSIRTTHGLAEGIESALAIVGRAIVSKNA